jgi:hypothetical protein
MARPRFHWTLIYDDRDKENDRMRADLKNRFRQPLAVWPRWSSARARDAILPILRGESSQASPRC